MFKSSEELSMTAGSIMIFVVIVAILFSQIVPIEDMLNIKVSSRHIQY